MVIQYLIIIMTKLKTNIQFPQAIVSLAHSQLLSELADSLFIHMRASRSRTIQDDDRAQRSIIDHARIIEALEQRPVSYTHLPLPTNREV